MIAGKYRIAGWDSLLSQLVIVHWGQQKAQHESVAAGFTRSSFHANS